MPRHHRSSSKKQCVCGVTLPKDAQRCHMCGHRFPNRILMGTALVVVVGALIIYLFVDIASREHQVLPDGATVPEGH